MIEVLQVMIHYYEKQINDNIINFHVSGYGVPSYRVSVLPNNNTVSRFDRLIFFRLAGRSQYYSDIPISKQEKRAFWDDVEIHSFWGPAWRCRARPRDARAQIVKILWLLFSGSISKSATGKIDYLGTHEFCMYDAWIIGAIVHIYTHASISLCIYMWICVDHVYMNEWRYVLLNSMIAERRRKKEEAYIDNIPAYQRIYKQIYQIYLQVYPRYTR